MSALMAGLRVSVEGRIAWLVLSRPETLNSLDSETLGALAGALREHCRSSGTSLIVITGEGRLFSAGIDLAEVASASTPADAGRPFRALASAIQAILDCGKPVVALLNGPAVAGGAELMAACDLAYAVRGAWIQWPELKWGLIPPVAASLTLPEHVKARLIVAMDRVDAEDAVRYGLLSGVYESLEEARRAVEALASSLAGSSPAALAAALSTVREPKRSAVKLAEKLVELAESMELIEKARAFTSKRGK